MRFISSPTEVTAASKIARLAGKRVGFVPTMGALHQGHLSLVRAASAQSDLVIASIFVNPTQFGPNEDFAKYPRTLEQDSSLLAAEGVDVLFSPSVGDIYPQDARTWVVVEGMSERLDGRSRPGHFRGVTTVVAKLFNIVQPDVAFFGQKDAAQAAILRKMARDLHFHLQIVVGPTVREPDGLAMSSRNVYLSPDQRRQATVLYRLLSRIQALVDQGERRSAVLISSGTRVIAEEPEVRLDYLEIVDRDTLQPLADISEGALVAVAAYVGPTRLIDNLPLAPRGQEATLNR